MMNKNGSTIRKFNRFELKYLVSLQQAEQGGCLARRQQRVDRIMCGLFACFGLVEPHRNQV